MRDWRPYRRSRRRREGGDAYDHMRPAGRVLSTAVVAYDNLVVVQATISLTGTAWLHWYVDGVWQTRTQATQFTIYVEPDQLAEIVCRVSAYRDYDPALQPVPLNYPGRRTLEWVSSTASDLARYRIEQATGSGTPATEDWTPIGRVRHDGRWLYRFVTPLLDDATYYWHRIVPVDTDGNDGTALELSRHYCMRRPAPPAYTATFDDATQRVTFDEA